MKLLLRNLGWFAFAACHDADPELFFWSGEADEPPYPSAEARAYCRGCAVRPECLQAALDNPDVVGIWGGTSSYQRTQLRRRRHRVHCPDCSSTAIAAVPTGDGIFDELCLACGLSWSANGTQRTGRTQE